MARVRNFNGKTAKCNKCKGKGYTVMPFFKIHINCDRCKGRGTIRIWCKK